MVKDRLIFALLGILAIGVYLADVYLTPEALLPAAAYAVPIVIAAWALPPRQVAAISIWAGLLEIAAALANQSPPYLFAIYMMGIVFFGTLSTALAYRTRRQAALTIEARSRAAELERAAAENARLYQQTQYERTRWQATVESMLDPVTVGDAEGHATYMNQAYTRMVGMTIDDGLPLEEHSTHYQLYRPDGCLFEPEELPLQRAALRGEAVRDVEIVERTVWGDRRITIWNASPLRDEAGKVTGAVAVGRDVTEQRRTEAERERLLASLGESNRRLVEANQTCSDLAQTAERRAAEMQSVLDNMSDGVYVANAEGRLTLANHAAFELLGMDVSEDVDLGIGELDERLSLRTPDGNPRHKHQQPLPRALAGEIVTLDDSVLRDPRTGRNVYLRTNASPMRDARGQIVGAVAVTRDVTSLADLEHIKDQLITVAAHELKTPVTIMKGYAQLLLRKGGDLSPERRKMLDSIDRGASRIDALVQGLLDMSLLASNGFQLALERVDLADLVEQTADRMAVASPTHRIRLVRADRTFVQADRRRLVQVLDNLLDNAVRYSPSGGTVEVEVRVEEDRAVVVVKDQGIGIPAHKQAHIFERLYRAHTDTAHDYGGMGVGLYLSREIVRRHGGEMDFESEEGAGSAFRFSLPLGKSEEDS